jgi:hypothetical protein
LKSKQPKAKRHRPKANFMKNQKIQVSFQGRIMWAEFSDKAVISDSDIKEMYTFAEEKAKGQKYCVMFEAMGHFDVTEEGLEYMLNNPHDKHVLAKVYIIGTQESKTKANLHILFDQPELKPVTFKTSREGLDYLKDIVAKNRG